MQLELELVDISSSGDILEHAKESTTQTKKTQSLRKYKELRNNLEIHRFTLIGNSRMVLPTQGGLDQLKYRTKAAREFVLEINDTQPQYKKYQTIDTMVRKLEYAIQVASKTIKELE